MTTSARLRRLLAAVLVSAAALASASAPPTADGALAPLDVRARVRLLPGGGATLLQRGTFAGAPLGRGTLSLRTTLGAGRGATFRFQMVTARGSVRGTGDVAVSFRGTMVTYRGTASITEGTGALRGVRARGLLVAGSGPVSGETFAVHLTGRARS
jgi:hypothetical protein